MRSLLSKFKNGTGKNALPTAAPSAPESTPKPSNLVLVYFRYRMGRYRLFWLTALPILALDQLTKLAVALWVPITNEPGAYGINRPIEIISGFFNLVHVYNKGAAFSILSGYGWLLALAAGAVLAGAFFLRRNLELHRPPVQFALGLLSGGIVGNLLDRLFRGRVLDFLDFDIPLFGKLMNTLCGWPEKSHWPAFNVADMGICVGVLLYMTVTTLLTRKTNTPKPTAPPPPPAKN